MPSGRLLRWMYRTGRPNRLAAVLNRISAWHFATGRLAPRQAVTLEVTGRTSGRTISLPLVVADLDGEEYLVSMLGTDVGWVRNVRAAGGRAVLVRGTRRPVVLLDVPVEQRAPIIKRYLALAPGGRPHIPVDRHAPLSAFEAVAADYPVFRVTPG